MNVEVLTDRPDLLIRRQLLAPGEATPWHTDRCHRFSVVVRGERLAIEFEGGETVPVEATPGTAGWDAPEPRRHRALNTGATAFEEVVLFFRDPPGCDPQPAADRGTPSG